MNNIRNIAIFLLFTMIGFYACEEGERFAISSGDTTPPASPVLNTFYAVNGGAVLFFTIPDDEDVISIEGSYIAKNGEVVTAAVSIYADSLKVLGMADTLEHIISLYSVDRAGNKSKVVPVPVTPLEPAFTKVAKTLKVRESFSSLIIEWDNELRQDINVYLNLSYPYNGTVSSVHHAISSRKVFERQFIKDLDILETDPVQVSFSIADAYGNESQVYDLETKHVKRDVMLDKSKMSFFDSGKMKGKDNGNNVIMADGNRYEGRMSNLLDGMIENDGSTVQFNQANFSYPFNMRCEDGVTRDVNRFPFNILIDLGVYYELSRIVTVQRWVDARTLPDLIGKALELGVLYGYNAGADWNVGRYEVYYLDETTDEWQLIDKAITIPKPPEEWSNLEKVLYAAKGDEAFMYPDDPHFTPPTRYFRYKALNSFGHNYADVTSASLSEITLYGRKATR
jgi:hypothetical protein